MPATQKLYETDATLRRFYARVLDCQKMDSAYAVLLDRTAFFPEGGGQGADHGLLGGVPITDVHEKQGEVWHTAAAPLAVGAFVEGVVDGVRRDDLTVQHSGEHIVSGLIHRYYGFHNVGFHLGSDVVTIDFDGILTPAELSDIELAANLYVREDHPVQILLPTREELSRLDYRSKKEIAGQVRIVRFPEADTCACCGTHVARTGEIGLIRLLSVQRFRSGCRIEMLSGARAFSYLARMEAQNRRISALLSAKPAETADAVERLLQELSRQKAQIAHLQSGRFAQLAARFSGDANALLFEPDLDADAVRRLCTALLDATTGLCAVFSGDDDAGYKYALGQRGGDIRTLTRQLNAALSGRGGGRDPFFSQGSVHAAEPAIRAFFAALDQAAKN